ncbi:MAG: hypothetical protein IJB82_00950 [Bacilli bacterium]|nr:hypothetical protein [Bacilli bacterium]
MNSSNITSILKNLNLTTILNGANKTLNIVKQAVPIYKEIKPLIGNAKNIIAPSKENVQKIVPQKRPLVKKHNFNNNLNNNLTFFQ